MRRGGTLSLPINLSIEIFVFRPFGWIVLNVLDCVKIIFFATDYMVVETPVGVTLMGVAPYQPVATMPESMPAA